MVHLAETETSFTTAKPVLATPKYLKPHQKNLKLYKENKKYYELKCGLIEHLLHFPSQSDSHIIDNILLFSRLFLPKLTAVKYLIY